jgi:hypothetical protein
MIEVSCQGNLRFVTGFRDSSFRKAAFGMTRAIAEFRMTWMVGVARLWCYARVLYDMGEASGIPRSARNDRLWLASRVLDDGKLSEAIDIPLDCDAVQVC